MTTPAEIMRRAKLDNWLEKFGNAMRRKFEARHEMALKRWGASVIDSDFDFMKLNHAHIENHSYEEFREWGDAEAWLASGGTPNHDQIADEDVDRANLALLDWIYHQLALMEEEASE